MPAIGNHAFENCTSLTDLTIGNGVTRIGDRAFAKCERLTSVTIPSSVTSISVNTFYTDEATGNGYGVESASFNGCPNIRATYKGKTYDYDHINDLYKAING